MPVAPAIKTALSESFLPRLPRSACPWKGGTLAEGEECQESLLPAESGKGITTAVPIRRAKQNTPHALIQRAE